jgi:hypothetical protein
MGLGFALVARSRDWEAGELAALGNAHNAVMDLDLGRVLDKEYMEEPLVDGLDGSPPVGMCLSVLDISGGTSLRLREVSRLTSSLRCTQERLHAVQRGGLRFPRLVLRSVFVDFKTFFMHFIR